MKKILLGILIAILALGAVLDTKDYVLGNKFDETKLFDYSGVFEQYSDILSEMETNLSDAGMDIASINNRIYKLPNNHYYTLQMYTGHYKKSTYLYSGLIEFKNSNEVILSLPKNKLELVTVNQEFKDRSWQINSKAGAFDFEVGNFGNSNTDDRKMSDDSGERGLRITLSPKKDVIEINNNGVWLDHAKFKVGMQKPMKVFNSEQEAVNAVKQDDFGKALGVIKSKDMNFYVFKNQVEIFKEITIIPVSHKDNQIKAGKYERFTFEKDDGVKEVIEEQVDNVNYTLRFQQSSDKFEKIANQLKDGDMHIAVKVRGEDHAK